MDSRLGQSRRLYGNSNFRLLWGGRGVSEFGDFFGELALSWLVLTATGSALMLGLTWLIFLVPRSVVRLWGGVYVDRFERRAIMVATETSRAALFGLVALAVLSGGAPVLLVYVVSFSVGLFGALFDLASDALLPLVVESEDLLKANSLFTATFQADNVLGPALAGLAIFSLGTAIPLLVDSASFLVLVAALVRIKPGPLPERAGPRMSWSGQFGKGWAFFRAHSELVWMAAMVAGVNFGLGAFWYVYALIFSTTVLSAGVEGYGWMNAFSALGIMLSSLYLVRSGVGRKRVSVVASMLIMGVAVTLIGFTVTLYEALLLLLVFGGAIPLIDIVATTYYQQAVPKELMGRVFGVRQFINYVTVPAGIIFGIFSTRAAGVADGIVISGLVVLGFGLASVFASPLRRLDAAPQPSTLAG